MATVVQPDTAAELAETFGEISETVTVLVGGKSREVKITPFRLRQFSHVLKCVQRLRDCGVVDDQTLTAVAEAEDAAEAASGFDMVKMLLDGGDDIINIVQVAVGGQIAAHELDKLSLIDGARLASGTFAVNLDFFYQNRDELIAAFTPAAKAIEAVMAGGVEALGQPPSTDSEAPVTP